MDYYYWVSYKDKTSLYTHLGHSMLRNKTEVLLNYFKIQLNDDISMWQKKETSLKATVFQIVIYNYVLELCFILDVVLYISMKN